MVTSKLGKLIAVWLCVTGAVFLTGLLWLALGIFPESHGWRVAYSIVSFTFLLSIDATILKWLFTKPKVKK